MVHEGRTTGWADIRPPLWIADPFQVQRFPTNVLLHVATFILVWHLVQGHRLPATVQIVLCVLLVGFGLILFRLRKEIKEKFGDRDNAFIHSYYGVPEAWLNLFPLCCSILVILCDLPIWSRTQALPGDPVNCFAMLWVFTYSVTHLLNAGPHVQFYDWFHRSGMEIAKRRGWGARGFNLYGVFPQTKLPRMSTNAFLWLSLFLTYNLYASLLSPFPSALHWLLSFFLVLLRHSMLFAENNAGMHKPVLLPAVCWYLACSPQMWGVISDGIGPAWPTAFLKLHILSIYLMAGLGKILVTWMQGKWNWADGTNMQYYIFVSMWARPGADLEAIPRLSWLVQRPWACVLVGLGGLFFEVGCPVAVFGGYWAVGMFIVSVGFHYGVFFLQGIDFTGQWVPCLLVFLIDQRPVTSLSTLLPTHGWQTPWFELVLWCFGAAHLVGQLYCAFTLREVSHEGDKGGIPYSCLHMFTVNSNIFGDDFCSWYTLMTGDQRSSGHLGIMEWSGPVFTDFNMSEEDMMRLPFKVVWFGHTMCKHKFLEGVVKPEYQQQRFLVFSNFNIGDDLREALQRVCRMLEPNTDPRRIRDPNTLAKLVKLQRVAQEEFLKDVVRDTKHSILVKRTTSFVEGGDALDDKLPEQLLKMERSLVHHGASSSASSS